jgi:MFS family permease
VAPSTNDFFLNPLNLKGSAVIVALVPLVSLFISCFILMSGYGLIGILLPVRMDLESIPTDTIGLVLAMYAVGMLFGGMYCRKLIARAGYIRVLAAGAALSSTAILICSLTMNVWVWGAMRGLMGFCIACVYAVIDGWLSADATEETRGKMLATSQITIMAAMFCSQFFINIAPPLESTLFILAAIILSVGLVPLTISKRTGPKIQEMQGMSYASLIKASPLGVTTCFFAGILYGSTMNLLPIFANTHGINGVMLSLFMASAVFGAFVFQFPVGILSDKMDRRTLLFYLLILNVIATVSMFVVAKFDWIWMMMGLTAITTGVFSCLYPMSISETFDRLRQSEMAAAMGGILSIYAMGSIFGPIVSSKIMTGFGADSLFIFLTVAEIMLLAFVLYRMKVRTALPVADQESFVMHTDMSAALYDLDPRIPASQSEGVPSLEAQVAITMAESNPGSAVKMVKELIERSPDLAPELYTALAQVDEIDLGRLFDSITRAAPDLSLTIAEALADSAPEQVTELVQWISEHQPERLDEIVTAIARLTPSQPEPTEVIEEETTHADASSGDVEAEESTGFDSSELRPADLEAYQESAAELVSHFAEHQPEQAMDVATAVVEMLPDSASDVVEILHEADSFDEPLSMDINDKPEEDTQEATEDKEASAEVPKKPE